MCVRIAVPPRSIHLANGAGAAGCGVCILSMLLPVILGTAGAAASATESMGGMAGAGRTGVLWTIVGGVNAVGPILLIASFAAILYGMRRFGPWPLSFAAAGGVALYLAMYVLSPSAPWLAGGTVLLAVAYGLAYGPLLRRRRRGEPRPT